MITGTPLLENVTIQNLYHNKGHRQFLKKEYHDPMKPKQEGESGLHRLLSCFL